MADRTNDDSFLTHIRLSLSRDHFLGSLWRLEDNVIVILGKAITLFEAGSLISLKLTSSVAREPLGCPSLCLPGVGVICSQHHALQDDFL